MEVTQMETKAFKVSWILLIVVHCVVIIMGLSAIFIPQSYIAKDYQLLTGHIWSDFVTSNPQVSSYISILTFEVGIVALAAGITALFITLFAYRKGENWAWYIILIANTLGWGGVIRENTYSGDMVVVLISIIFLVIAYVGLAIGGKAILKKASS
jgi:hypothetical protein